MALEERYGVYHFAEEALVESNSTTGMDVMSLPTGTIVEQVLVEVHSPAVRAAGAVNLTVGDGSDADGFIVATDAKAAKGTVKGQVPTERGDYLYDSTVKGSYIKKYAADETVRLVLSAAILTTDTEGEYLVTVIGHRVSMPA